MALFGSIETVRAQTQPTEKFAAAFGYLEEVFRSGSPAAARLRALAAGETQRIELAGGAFALEQAYLSKPRPEGFFEAHRKFIDVQVIVEGEEWMEVIDVARTAVKDAYQPERDLTVYQDSAGASRLHFGAGDAAVYFPADAHMPGLRAAADAGLVRKVVIKVPVAAN